MANRTIGFCVLLDSGPPFSLQQTCISSLLFGTGILRFKTVGSARLTLPCLWFPPGQCHTPQTGSNSSTTSTPSAAQHSAAITIWKKQTSCSIQKAQGGPPRKPLPSKHPTESSANTSRHSSNTDTTQLTDDIATTTIPIAEPAT